MISKLAKKLEKYNIHTDEFIERKQPTNPRHRNKIWTTERAIYDIRYDAYWLVTKDISGYRFAGPIALSKNLISLLPPLNELERRDVLRHVPKNYTDAPWGIHVEQMEEEENDGA